MSEILLSVLIPSIPTRLPKLTALLEIFSAQAHPQLEVLVFLDNCQRALGRKRNALMQQAAGRFCCHIDDDDTVSLDFFARLLPELQVGVDLVHFDADASLNGALPFKVTTVLGAHNQQPRHLSGGRYSDIIRTPWHFNCWRTELARQFKFPEVFNGAEDAFWLNQILPAVKTSRKVDAVLFHHFYDSRTTTFPTS
jgi:hypothetical protein